MNNNPFVIAFDGMNGVGKTTVCQKVEKLLQRTGARIERIRLPGAHQLASTRSIRTVLDLCGKDLSPLARASLYLADFSEYVDKFVKQNILNVDILLTDRSILSTLIYQVTLEKTIEDIFPIFLNKTKEYIFPNILVFLKPPNFKTAMNQIKASKGESEGSIAGYGSKDMEWYEKLHNAYIQVYEEYGWPTNCLPTCWTTNEDIAYLSNIVIENLLHTEIIPEFEKWKAIH